MALAKLLVVDADVWLNMPLLPLEASGTSGMKAALNEGLNLSIPDGWWIEAWIEIRRGGGNANDHATTTFSRKNRFRADHPRSLRQPFGGPGSEGERGSESSRSARTKRIRGQLDQPLGFGAPALDPLRRAQASSR